MASSASLEKENIRVQSKFDDLTTYVTLFSREISELIDKMEEKEKLVPVIVRASTDNTDTANTKDYNNDDRAKIKQPDGNSTHKETATDPGRPKPTPTQLLKVNWAYAVRAEKK